MDDTVPAGSYTTANFIKIRSDLFNVGYKYKGLNS